MNEYEFRKYTDIAERFCILGVIEHRDVEFLFQQVESMRLRLQQDNPAVCGPRKTVMSFIREEN